MELPPGISMETLLKCYERTQKHNEKEKLRYHALIATEEGRAKVYEPRRKHYERNREKILAARKKAYEENREVLVERQKMYREKKKRSAEEAEGQTEGLKEGV